VRWPGGRNSVHFLGTEVRFHGTAEGRSTVGRHFGTVAEQLQTVGLYVIFHGARCYLQQFAVVCSELL